MDLGPDGGATLVRLPAEEVLAGGWYFATETARILGGAGGALDPETGAALVRARPRRDPTPERPTEAHR